MDKAFAAFANKTAKVTGSPWTFGACLLLVILWAVSGPVFGFSETWQLVINTSTTIITFLMVFLIQNTQNRDAEAMHAKLDDLIISSAAEDDFVGIETMTEKELKAMHDRCTARAKVHEKVHAKVTEELENRKRKRRPATRKPAARTAA
ncbi:MAG: low affinity iron permease family protein [Alphaproteobacteria bacterium]|nr:low affinity iron permease family protein [Alphaproteobacteria bacterium]MBU1516874.1 low affinity iron permease family protein [Alphaproteobacteria bacterium]MBU2092569.1 low affinity iron permease family protein [Alphaproteobacteria bacterium]MBU2151320.1 low affinity iron permease family protein [Alphaproteobacteria bacterium]MBU2309622.1 low affinity iron permease family protein [Alphaproteobacteria bacterium]